MATACSSGGNHEEGAPQDEGDRRVVRCKKCGSVMSSGMIPKPGDIDSDE